MSKNHSSQINAMIENAYQAMRLGRYDEARKIYEILTINSSGDPIFANIFAQIALQNNLITEGIIWLRKSLEINPNQADILVNLGAAFSEINEFDDALDYFSQAIKVDANNPLAHFNQGLTYGSLNQLDNALNSYKNALKIDPNYADALNGIGRIYHIKKEYYQAIEYYDKAIKYQYNHAGFFYNKAMALNNLKEHLLAIDNYYQALKYKPDYFGAYNNLGNVLRKIKRYDEALAAYDRAFQLKPDNESFDYCTYLQTKSLICNWTNFDQELDILLNQVRNNEIVSTPFALLSLIDNPEIQKKTSEIFIKERCPLDNSLGEIKKYPKHQRIRLGYFSADFHRHATMFLMAELFELHDKDKFELYAFSFGPKTSDPWQLRAMDSFDQFIDVRFKSDKEVAAISRNLEIDIAIDLKGFTKDSRTGIFSYRTAPIQINYLGYPGTMAASYIDYLIADSTLIDASNREYFSEKIIYLPNCYQVNLSKRDLSNKPFLKKDLGISEDSFVFCSFNNSYKINPKIFSIWIKILKQVKSSTLLIMLENDSARINLIKESKARGINSNRLIFVGRLPIEEHLKRIQVADLFLDTFPYNAHTTASDVLYAGVPLLTLSGKSFASRVAASLLNAIDVPELITSSQAEYEQLAIELASDAKKLGIIKNKIIEGVKSSSLFNTKEFARDIEAGYLKAYEAYQKGKGLSDIVT